MATYQDIKGLRIKYLSTDPSLSVGEVWYNSTTGTFRSHLISTAWSSSSPMIAGVGAAAGNSGIQTAAFYAGGTPGVVTQEYNGSGWSLGGNINTERYRLTGAGTQTAGLVFGGQNPANTAIQTATEEYDGTTWTSNPTGLGTGRSPVSSAGTQTAGLAFGGRTSLSPPYSDTAATEEYDGSSWAAGGNMPAIKIQQSGTGLQTAALGIGGQPSPTTTTTYEYDGSSWSEGGALNTGRAQAGAAGTQTGGLVFGGGTANTEDYDGSSWTTSPATLGTSRETGGFGPMGTNTAALLAGSTGASVLTEEFNKSTTIITAGAWASGGNLSGGRYELGTVGTQDAGLAFGGNNVYSGLQSSTEEYNGSSWAAGGSLPATKATQGLGTQTAAVAVGGTVAPNPSAGSTTEEYNGTSWGSGGSLNTATVAAAASTGIESAGLRAGGGSTPASRLSAVEEYNGSSWASVTSLAATRFQFQGTGPQTASFFTGGNTAPGTTETTDSFDYDGTSWASGPTMIFGIRLHAVSGNSNTANLSFAGEQSPGPGVRSLAQSFDGTAFITSPSLAQGRESLGGCGTASASLAAGGNNAPSYNLVNTEEFTGETSATASTLTTS